MSGVLISALPRGMSAFDSKEPGITMRLSGLKKNTVTFIGKDTILQRKKLTIKLRRPVHRHPFYNK